MSLPELVSSLLGDESVAAEVSLGGEDALYVTSSRTLVYRADGLLSDESVDQYSHDAERIAVSEGRRKSKITLDYGLDGEKRFSVPTKRLDDALHAIVAGVFGAVGIVDAGETVERTFRFSELTVVVTSARIVKHIGAAVWDGDFEEFRYEDVTDLDFEEGSVATSVVVTIGNRQERFKAPKDDARMVRESLKAALLSYHGAPNLPAFRRAVAPDDAEEGAEVDAEADAASSGGSVDFGDGPDPLSAEPAAEAEARADAAAASGAGTETGAGAGAGAGAGTEATNGTGTGSSATGAEATPNPAAAASSAVGNERGRAGEGATDVESRSGASGSAAVAGAGADGDGADEFGGSGFRSAGPVDEADVAAELAELTAAVEAQSEELRRQRGAFETLIEELRRGR